MNPTNSNLSDFKKLMFARFSFTLGVQMQAILLGWQMYRLTEDPFFLGLVGLCEAIPALGLALYAGYIVDRGWPVRIYRRLLFVSFVSATILLFSQLERVGLTNQMKIIALFASSFLTGTARAFSQPCTFSIVPKITRKEDLPKTSAWMSSAMQVARISGPAVAGFLYAAIGISSSAVFVCLSLIVGMVCMSMIKVVLPPELQSPASGSLKRELFSGVKFVFTHSILLPALSLDMISVLFGGVTSLLPIYAAKILLVGPTGLGLLRAAPAMGAAITSFWLTRVFITKRAGHYLLSAVAGFGVCIIVFAMSHDFWLSMVALFMSGAFDSVSMVIRTSAVQLSSPDSMRGKISAVNSMFIGSSNELGEFESGVAAKIMGTVPSAIFGGVVCLLTVATVGWLSPALRRLELDKLKS